MNAQEPHAGRPSTTAACITALAVVQALCCTPAAAQQPAAPRFRDEVTKQEGIYQSRGKSVPGGYVTDRGLDKYGGLLHSGFERALSSLGSRDRWLDIGAGSGQAILDYQSPAYRGTKAAGTAPPDRKARAVALSIEDRRTESWGKKSAALAPDQVRYLFGKRLREYQAEELGRFQLITDVYGGFSYTEELSQFTQRVLDLLELDGNFYTLVQSVRLEDGTDPPSTYYLTEIVDAAGRDVKVCSWLKSIACVAVSCESRSDSEWHTPTELIRISKVCGEVSVPALTPLLYEAGSPPGRRFQLKR